MPKVLKAILDWFLSIWLITDKFGDLKEIPEYREAIKWRETFEPKDEKDYTWVCDYAEAIYEMLHDGIDKLDEKADAVIKYLGGGTAIVTLAAITNVTHSNAPLVLFLLPSLVLALIAIYLAVQSRLPTIVPRPPRVDQATQYAEAYDKKAKETFLAQWHEACVGITLVIGQKAQMVSSANRYYYRALLCLLIPLVAWTVWKFLETPPEPARIEFSAPPTKIEVEIPTPKIRIKS